MAGRIKTITRALVDRINKLVGYGLSDGLGDRGRGQMCVQACVSAALEEEHSDNPSCVPDDRMQFGIDLNDRAGWSSPAARGKGLKRWAIAQLGSSTKPEKDFAPLVLADLYSKRFPVLLKDADAPHEFVSRARNVRSKADVETLFDRLEQHLAKQEGVDEEDFDLDEYNFELADLWANAPDEMQIGGDWSGVFDFFYPGEYSDQVNTEIAEAGVRACIRMRTEGSEWLENYEKKSAPERDAFIRGQQKIGKAQEEAARAEATRRGSEMRSFLHQHVDKYDEFIDDDDVLGY